MDQETSEPAQEASLFEWETFEYEYRQKATDWYWAVGIISLSFTVAAYLLDSFFFAALIAVSGFVLLLYGAKKPGVLTCRILPRGIQVDRRLYPFISLESFGIDETSTPKLIIKSKKVFAPFLVLPLGDTPVEALREVLLPRLQEEEHLEPLPQKLLDRLGF